jgi:hypothetical protein
MDLLIDAVRRGKEVMVVRRAEGALRRGGEHQLGERSRLSARRWSTALWA